MTERPHFRSENHLKTTKFIVDLDPAKNTTAHERWQRQYDFTPETNLGRAALGCGTELFLDSPPIEDDPKEFGIDGRTDAESSQD